MPQYQGAEGGDRGLLQGHRGTFTKPGSLHILVKSEQNADELLRLQGCASFAALAKKFSRTRPQAGRQLRWQGQRGASTSRVSNDEARSPSRSKLSRWHIIEALAPIEVTKHTEAKTTIEQQLKQQKQSAACKPGTSRPN